MHLFQDSLGQIDQSVQRLLELPAKSFGGLENFAPDILFMLLLYAGEDSLPRVDQFGAPVVATFYMGQERCAKRSDRHACDKAKDPTRQIRQLACVKLVRHQTSG
jgi:hypothetical protein